MFQTVIDNIFTNYADETSMSGNLSYFISDLLAQFLIYTEFKTKAHCKQETIYKRRLWTILETSNKSL